MASDPARTRFIALGLFRLSGALIAFFGLAIFAERVGITGDNARQLGAIVILVGLMQFVLVPRLLAGAWRSRP